MDIKITIELAEKERTLFGAFVEAVSALALTKLDTPKNAQEEPKALTPTENPKEVKKEEPAKPIKATEAPKAKAEPEEPKVEAPTEDKPALTTADIRKKYMDLVAKNKKLEAQTIIKKYAPNITAIEDKDLLDVMLALQILEGSANG